MTNGRGSDDWDSFDFDAWGAETAANGEAGGTNGHTGKLHQNSIDSSEEPVGDEGRWVSQGGVLHWEAPDDAEESALNPRAEANSRWADDDVESAAGRARYAAGPLGARVAGAAAGNRKRGAGRAPAGAAAHLRSHG